MRTYYIDYTDSNGIHHRPEIQAEGHTCDRDDGLYLLGCGQAIAYFAKSALNTWCFTEKPEPSDSSDL